MGGITMANYNERISKILKEGALPKEEDPDTFFNVGVCEWSKSEGAPYVPVLIFQFKKEQMYYQHTSKTLLNGERCIFIGNSENSVLNEYPFNITKLWVVRIVRDENILTGLYRVVAKNSKARRLLTMNELHSMSLYETQDMNNLLDCKALIIPDNQKALSIKLPWDDESTYYINPGDIVII